MRHFSTGLFRPLKALVLRAFVGSAAAFLLFAAQPSMAADFTWQALPDRERIRITLAPAEALAGKVGRIEPTAVVIPFTQIPPGVVVPDAPEGARIFKRSKAQGRALVLVTQTAEFGYVVTTQSSTELVVDFFPNPLGARWKPSGPSPVTELPPEHGVAPVAQPDAASAELAGNPQGTDPKPIIPPQETPPEKPEATPSTTPVAAPAPVQEAPAQASAQQPVPDPAVTAVPAPPVTGTPRASASPVGAPVLPESAPTADRPVVVELDGSPQRAVNATQMTDPAQGDSRVALPPESSGQQVTPPVAPRPAPLLDTSRETSERAAPLPQPAPPMSVVTGPVAPVVNGVAIPAAPNAPVSVNGVTQASTAAPTAPQAPMDVDAAPQPSGQPEAAAPQPAPAPVQQAPQNVTPGVGSQIGQGVYGGAINLGGPESLHGQAVIPATEQPLTTATPDSPAQEGALSSSAVAEAPATVDPHAPDVPPVEGGEPIPPPLTPEQILPYIRQDMQAGNFPNALLATDQLLALGPHSPEVQEELLHIRAEMLFALNKDNLGEHYTEIMDASNKAFYFNQKSPRNAGVLLRQGYMALNLKNIPEAEARFNLLRRLFPNDENIPLTYYYWGNYHFGRDELQKAADEFQYVLQHYPNSRFAREAALALSRTFYRLGYYDQAFNIVDYIEKRWERFYVEYPPFLNTIGDVAFRLQKYDDALKHYWLYVNLAPSGEETDVILTRIGDIYSQQRERAAAREIYTDSVRRFPDKDGALVAMMRLAEEGIYDDPSISAMFPLFDGPTNFAPAEVYKTIITKHPDSALVPLAEIKLGLWHLWKHDYGQTLDLMSSFGRKHPNHELVPKAREIALQTFGVLASESINEARYGYILQMWDEYPILREQVPAMPMESRLALSVALRHEGRPDEALQLLGPFFQNKSGIYSDMALSVALTIYLEYEQWLSIREVAQKVELWELKPETREQLEYALALAAENLDESDVAAPLWQSLYDSGKLPPAQMAYATYFLAREAQRKENLEIAYNLGKEALRRLLEQVERTPNAQDVGKIQTQLAALLDISERAGRLREALSFAQEYMGYLPENGPERTVVRYRMARIHKKQGDSESWKNILDDIAAKEPGSVYGQLAASELRAADIARDAARYSPTGQL